MVLCGRRTPFLFLVRGVVSGGAAGDWGPRAGAAAVSEVRRQRSLGRGLGLGAGWGFVRGDEVRAGGFAPGGPEVGDLDFALQ